MKKICLLLLLITLGTSAQNPEVAKKLVLEGVEFYDEGKYSQALAKYEAALKVDKNNLFALAEKAITLNTTQNYNEVLTICKKIIKLYPNEDLAMIYVTYGNTLDVTNNALKAIKVYDEGIQKFPNMYQLYFNKGVALIGLGENDRANDALQAATVLKPNHPGSFNALAILNKNNRIPAIMSACRFLSLDNKSARANDNIEYILTLMNQGVEKSGTNTVNITLSDFVKKDENRENDFSSVNLMISMSAAYELTDENKNKTDVEKFSDKLSILFSSLASSQKNQSGYYWEYLAPYFIEMKKQDLINTFANIAFAAKNDKNAMQYLKENKEKVDAFYKWSNSYPWIR